MKKSNSNPFAKFGTRKSNAAIKEQFRQEKRKVKKEREAFFDQKRAAAKGIAPTAGAVKQVNKQTVTQDIMPLNKFIAYGGVAARREAAELVKKGIVKVNGVVVPAVRLTVLVTPQLELLELSSTT